LGFTDSVEPSLTLALEAVRRETCGDVVSIHDLDPTKSGQWPFLRAVLGRRDVAHPVRALSLLRARSAQWRRARPGVTSFLRRLSGYQLLVSGRFHACTLALVAGTPFIALGSNTGKIQALLEDAGLADWRCVERLDARTVAKARELGWTEAERSACRAYLQRARDGADGLFVSLSRMAR
jgi:hypothetical protein